MALTYCIELTPYIALAGILVLIVNICWLGKAVRTTSRSMHGDMAIYNGKDRSYCGWALIRSLSLT